MADQVSNAVETGSVTAPVPDLHATIPEQQGIEALNRLRERKAATEQSSVADPNVEQQQKVDEPPTETDTDEEIPSEEELGELNEEPTTDVEIGPIAFHLDDGTPVSAEEAKKGYLRREDYSQKTAAVSEIQSAAQARIQIVDQAAEFMAARIPFVVDLIQKSIPAEPDESLRATDPGKYWDQYNIRRVKLEEVRQLEQGFENFKAARDEEQRIAAHEKFVSESAKLLEKLPSWKNPKVAAKERIQIAQYGRKMGYSDTELASIDHRGILVIRDAMLGARVRAAGGKKPTMPNPTIQTGKTTGIGGVPRTTPAAVSQSVPKVDPNASNRTRFTQGVALLAARRKPH